MNGWWMDEFGCWQHTVCGRIATKTSTHLECIPCRASKDWPQPDPQTHAAYQHPRATTYRADLNVIIEHPRGAA